MKKNARRAEFGDFQTPRELALRACRVLHRLGARPASIIEPTCGTGSFLQAALEVFTECKRAVGIDINPSYVRSAAERLGVSRERADISVCQGDYFQYDWPELLTGLPDPLLVVGNPPWVTNAELGLLQSGNLPIKRNFLGLSGLDAVTGKANFDISEWMLLHMFMQISERSGILAMLCKTSVARRFLSHVWSNGLSLKESRLFIVDARAAFGASVDACFLVCKAGARDSNSDCGIYSDFESHDAVRRIAYRNGMVVANLDQYERTKSLRGESLYNWRSGIKHDCSKLMELTSANGVTRNGFGDIVAIEDECLFPLLKSSDLARQDRTRPERYMLVPQTTTGADTALLARRAPRTFEYLERHAILLDRRASSIYTNRPRFSVFGVGPYSFTPWKVAISGLHKSLDFRLIGPRRGKPVVFDDTCYFVACDTEDEARFLVSLLNSDLAKQFFGAHVFWDAKRPVNADILSRLDLLSLAKRTGTEAAFAAIVSCSSRIGMRRRRSRESQGSLFPHAGKSTLEL